MVGVEQQNMSIDNVKGRSVFITGSTEGIGKAIALEFANKGALVIVNGRSEDKVKSAVESIKYSTNSSTIFGIAADISIKEQVEDIFSKIHSILGSSVQLDILVNNTGIYYPKNFFEISDEDWVHIFNTNVLSGIRLTRHFLKQMLDRNSGRVINISSEVAFRPLPQMSSYSMTKAAQVSLSRSLAELTKGTKVTVNTILPGPTMTEGVRQYIKELAQFKGISEEQMEKQYFTENEPSSLLQRFITVEEVSNAVLFVVTNGAVNGSALRVEGGIIRSI